LAGNGRSAVGLACGPDVRERVVGPGPLHRGKAFIEPLHCMTAASGRGGEVSVPHAARTDARAAAVRPSASRHPALVVHGWRDVVRPGRPRPWSHVEAHKIVNPPLEHTRGRQEPSNSCRGERVPASVGFLADGTFRAGRREK